MMELLRSSGLGPGRHLLILEEGEPVIQTLQEVAFRERFQGASIVGLGAIMQATLGYFSIEEKKYQKRQFDEIYELISLTGNLSLKDNQPFVHAHVMLGASNFRCFGGHLFEAVCAVTVELTILEFDFYPERKLNSKFDLNLIWGVCHGTSE